MASELIDYLPAALSSAPLIVVVVVVLPKILDRVPKIIDACAFLILVRALVKRLGRDPTALKELGDLISGLRQPTALEPSMEATPEPKPAAPSSPSEDS